MEAFSATGASLGGMASAYFYPYAISQPAVGMLTDRFGARKILALSTVFGFLGALLFGAAPTLFIAAIGRGLIGLGAAGVFVPALKVLLQWFGPKSFGQMNAGLLAVGNVGAMVASTPFAWMIQQIGWRISFLLFAVVMIILGLLSWKYIQDSPSVLSCSRQEKSRKSNPSSQGVGEVFQHRFFWIMLLLFFAFGGPYSTFQGLWGYPFLVDVFGYGKLEAGNLIMVVAVGVIAGGPLLGYLIDKRLYSRRRQFLSACLLIQVGNWICIAFLSPRFGSFALGVSFFIMGMMVAGTLAVVWTIVREEAPPGKMGTFMGWLNPAPFLGVATFQPLTGYLMDRVGRTGGAFPFAAYQNAFILCFSSLTVAAVISFFLWKKGKSGGI